MATQRSEGFCLYVAKCVPDLLAWLFHRDLDSDLYLIDCVSRTSFVVFGDKVDERLRWLRTLPRGVAKQTMAAFLVQHQSILVALVGRRYVKTFFNRFKLTFSTNASKLPDDPDCAQCVVLVKDLDAEALDRLLLVLKDR